MKHKHEYFGKEVDFKRESRLKECRTVVVLKECDCGDWFEEVSKAEIDLGCFDYWRIFNWFGRRYIIFRCKR